MTYRNETAEPEGMLPLKWPAAAGALRRPGTPRAPIEKGLSARLLTELQKEVTELETERGTIAESIQQKSLLLTEEIFEVMKVLRVESGIATSRRPAVALGDELADVLFVCAAIANRIPTDLSVIWADLRPLHASNLLPRSGNTTTATLSVAVRLARQVLEVIESVASFKDEKPAADGSDSVAESLIGILLSIDLIAISKKIDLDMALEAKLQKDQLRLWQ